MEGTACAEAQGLYSACLGCRGCVYGGVVAAGKYEEMSFPRLYRDLCAQLGSLNFYFRPVRSGHITGSFIQWGNVSRISLLSFLLLYSYVS